MPGCTGSFIKEIILSRPFSIVQVHIWATEIRGKSSEIPIQEE